MGDIHINRGGQNLGIFAEADVQKGLTSGQFLGTDLAWRSGMENWMPLAQWSDFEIPLTTPTTTTPSTPSLAPGSNLLSTDTGLEELPSWEQRDSIGFFHAFGRTIKEVLVEPSATFSRMKETGGFMTPFLYMLTSWVVIFVFYCIMMFAFSGSIISALAAQNPEMSQVMLARSGGNLGGMICNLISIPIMAIITAFLGTALWHVALMILGGARKSFEVTFRVYCYTLGSTFILALIPCCGWLIAPVWNIVSGSIGLAKVHEIGVGKAVVAILLPLLLCFGFCGVGYYFLLHALMGNPDFMNAFTR